MSRLLASLDIPESVAQRSDGRASGRALKPARPKPFLASPARPRPEGDKPESPRALADKLGKPILVETML